MSSEGVSLPQALQIVWPASSLRQRGVIVVPQFWHAMTTVVFWPWRFKAPTSIGVGASGPLLEAALEEPWHFNMLKLADLETRLLYAGQPPHPSAPPVPLHFPPPGQLPDGVGSAAT